MIRTSALTGFFSTRMIYVSGYLVAYTGKVILLVADNSASKRTLLCDQGKAQTLAADACAGFFSRLTFSWYTGFLRYGYSNKIALKDLGQHTKSSADLYADFEVKWQNNKVNKRGHPLLRSLLEGFAIEIWSPAISCK